MTSISSKPNIPIVYRYSEDACACDLLILAAGFEERAFHFLKSSNFSENAFCLLVVFENEIPENAEIYTNYIKEIEKKFQKDRIIKTILRRSHLQKFESNLSECIAQLPRDICNVWVDISGMPTHMICSTLNVCRTFYSNQSQVIVYTSAQNYYPSYEEFKLIKAKSHGRIEFLPRSMAREMSEVLMLETFSGHRSKEGVSCLAVFAGYEAHRSAGVIENINPSMLLLLFGRPGNEVLDWRIELSRDLHKKFESTRKTAVEVVSTLKLNESIKILEDYYEYLYEDYDFTIAPICSKMEVVATYLFWERYREVQLAFPLPIGYSLDLRPTGIGETYITALFPRNSLYHSIV